MTSAVEGTGPAFSFAGGRLTVPMSLAIKRVMDFPAETLDLYDFAGGSGWNVVDGSDIGRLIASGMVGFAQSVAGALVKGGANAPWHGVPVDGRLEDAVPGDALETGGVALYDHFYFIFGVGWAIASKLLHLKRPAFFPIVDSYVAGLYFPVASILAGSRNPQVRFYWQAIRNDLVTSGQSAAINVLRANLAASSDPRVRRRATLSALRLRDILMWMSGPGAASVGIPPAGQISPLPR